MGAFRYLFSTNNFLLERDHIFGLWTFSLLLCLPVISFEINNSIIVGNISHKIILDNLDGLSIISSTPGWMNLTELYSSYSDNDITTFSDELKLTTTTTINYDYDLMKTSTIKYTNGKFCAFMNVTDNASYSIFDREDFSVGLSTIHNSSDIFEKFIFVQIEKGCEVTLCKLLLLDAKQRARKCFTMTESQSLKNLESTDAPDPITSQYIVSTGCSCKIPSPKCNLTQCEDVSVLHKDNECGRLYKESHCSECRYDVQILNVSESFIPSNTFWCKSFVIKDGCRLSIDVLNSTGQFNVRNYTGKSAYVELDYVRYPNPSVFSCLCDLEIENESTVKSSIIKWVLPVSLFTGVLIFAAVFFVLRKCGISLRIGNKLTEQAMEDMITKFQFGFTDQEVQTLTEEGRTTYVSLGFLNALKQPYQNKWEIPRNLITIDKTKKPLGVGQFGNVYLGKLDLQDGSNAKPVAVKTSKISKNVVYFVSILDEIKTLAFIGHHSNICGMIGACTAQIQKHEAMIVLELCSEGSLKTYLRLNKSKFLEPQETPKEVTLNNLGYAEFPSLSPAAGENRKISKFYFEIFLKFSMQIACGMEYLSQKQVVHIDLAARNILLTDTLDCKIGDFGLSQRLHEVANYVRIKDEYPLPIRWMALESLTDLKFTIQTDVWSYAVVLYEIFSLNLDPYPNIMGLADLIQILKDGKRLEKPNHAPEDLYQTMLQCWDADPSKRPSFGFLKYFFEKMQRNSSYVNEEEFI